MTIRRRDFIAHAFAGGAVLTVPGFLAGCGVQRSTAVAEPAPANPFVEWFGIDEQAIARVMSSLTAGGADLAEIYFQHARNNTLTFMDGGVAGADATIEQGVGLRVVIGDETGYAFTEDLTLPSMHAAARTAAAVARGTQAVGPQAFTPQAIGELYTTTVPWADVAVDRKLPILAAIDSRARSLDPAVERVSVRWGDSDERITIATLDGSLLTDSRPMASLTVLVTARKGEQLRSGFSSVAARAGVDWYTDDRLDTVVREAVERTLIQFDARRPPAGEMPVILAAGASGVLLHESIGHAMEADFNRIGTSPYSGRIGEKVAEPFVTLVDQAAIPRERGALNFDDEGTPPGRTVMVENGILRSYLHDRLSARQYGVTPTGSGRRESFRFAPMPRMTCTFMEGGPHTREEIIEAVDRGIICETFATGQVDLGAGDFTFDVKNGWLVEGGRVTAPVRDLRISGNGPRMLERITMVAGDARLDPGGWTCGKFGQNVPVSQGMPTVLVSSLAVGA